MTGRQGKHLNLMAAATPDSFAVERRNTMWTRFLPPMFFIALTTACYAKDRAKAISDIAEGIVSYRLSATFCNWPIPEKISRVLDSDENHFSGINPSAFNAGIQSGTDRFHLLTSSLAGYCHEIKNSRNQMTRSLERRAN